MNLELKNCNSTQFIIDLYISTFIFSKLHKKKKILNKKKALCIIILKTKQIYKLMLIINKLISLYLKLARDSNNEISDNSISQFRLNRLNKSQYKYTSDLKKIWGSTHWLLRTFIPANLCIKAGLQLRIPQSFESGLNGGVCALSFSVLCRQQEKRFKNLLQNLL